MKKVIGILLAVGNVAFTGCTAQAAAKNALVPPTAAVVAAHEQAGSYDDGLIAGERNGTLLAERVYKRTIGTDDCVALGDYEAALNAVTAKVKPTRKGGQFVAGFYRGYVNAITANVQKVRMECEQFTFQNGAFPGTFYGNVFCQAATADADALAAMQFSAIYDGWSASEKTLAECAKAFASVVDECAAYNDAQAEQRAAAVSAACSDVVADARAVW